MSSTNDHLRRAAILIDSLDREAADALLDQMGPSHADRVRRALLSLGEVREEERREVIAQFMARGEQPPSRPAGPAIVVDDSGIEIEESLAARLAKGDSEPEQRSPAPTRQVTPFRFLHETTGEMIAPFLRDENPQTIAVVLAHLPPEQAADVLARLDPAVQTDVVRRIAHLDETSSEVLRDVEQELGSRLSHRLHTLRRRSAGLTAVRQILSAADPSNRSGLLTHLATSDAALAQQLAEARSRPDAATIYRVAGPSHGAREAPSAVKKSSAVRGANQGSLGLRPELVGTESQPTTGAQDGIAFKHNDVDSSTDTPSRRGTPGPAGAHDRKPPTKYEAIGRTGSSVTAPVTAGSGNGSQTHPATAPAPPALKFGDLAKLSDDGLTAVFAPVPADLAGLALAGADEQFVRRVVKRLPAAQAKLLSAALLKRGPLRLSDIERAQQEIARIAERLARAGKAQPAGSREPLAMIA
jgi:flagellar motor switch protein FliG